MTSLPSGSDQGASAAFELLHPKVRKWIWQQRWQELRDAQEAAIAPLLEGDLDVLIAASTASGKTEAAFLPICSALAADPPAGPGFSVMYISPLKALINDQYGRLDQLCEHLEIPVARWHGDVGADRKRKLIDDPRGILLITPESLEALFVTRGWEVSRIVGALRYIVIDELHSFIGAERGAQLQSLLHRLDLAARRHLPRVGLSATLGDMAAAADYLRPGAGQRVRLVVSDADGQELRLRVHGYLEAAPDPARPEPVEGEQIADGLFTMLRGGHHLVFANSRNAVERYTDLLTRRCVGAGVPNEFVPHHGNLSKEIREDTEASLKDRSRPASAICTSTLEMGIDIGSVTSVAQIGAPPGVAALRQRLGRSGRRGGPAVLRVYVSELETTLATPPAEELRTQLVLAIASVELLLVRWYEPPRPSALHFSTLIQQVLSLIAQHGGITPKDAYRTLCATGPFRTVGAHVFADLLRDLGARDLVRQEPDGLLIHGGVGERLVNHYTFYAAFASPVEYRVVTTGRTLGTLPMEQPLPEKALFVFAGRRWQVVRADARSRVIEVVRSSGGRAPRFTGSGPDVHDRVRLEMRRIYEGDAVPVYLDPAARALLEEGRAAYRRFGLDRNPLVGWGADTVFLPFRGDVIMNTIALSLLAEGIAVERQGVGLLLAGVGVGEAGGLLEKLVAGPPPEAGELARLVPDKRVEKHDGHLGEGLLSLAYAARSLDAAAAWQALYELPR